MFCAISSATLRSMSLRFMSASAGARSSDVRAPLPTTLMARLLMKEPSRPLLFLGAEAEADLAASLASSSSSISTSSTTSSSTSMRLTPAVKGAALSPSLASPWSTPWPFMSLKSSLLGSSFFSEFQLRITFFLGAVSSFLEAALGAGAPRPRAPLGGPPFSLLTSNAFSPPLLFPSLLERSGSSLQVSPALPSVLEPGSSSSPSFSPSAPLEAAAPLEALLDTPVLPFLPPLLPADRGCTLLRMVMEPFLASSALASHSRRSWLKCPVKFLYSYVWLSYTAAKSFLTLCSSSSTYNTERDF
mmetsp:Transcript_25438/g.55232  ORF Transcript_25438/g.55232 Transcript_25438/m.55232 type:complete len:302 (+) Transcript_25438:1611-2516(+)